MTIHRQTATNPDTIGSYAPEDPVLQNARGLACEVGVSPVAPATGAALRLLAAASGARSVVEIGTGTGVSGLWLLRGMRADGVLTTIDLEAEHQRMARQLFVDAGFAISRIRMITGRAVDVLTRLADGGYDMVFVDADPTDFGPCVEAAVRLLRTGGVLALHGVLTSAMASDVVTAVRDSEFWAPAMIPVGDGLLAAVRLPDRQRRQERHGRQA